MSHYDLAAIHIVIVVRNSFSAFLAEAALAGAGGGISQQQGADHTSHNGVGCESHQALREDLVGGFSLDDDIQHRGEVEPSDVIADDLDDIVSQDVLPTEVALFNTGAQEGESVDEAGDANGDLLAPPV